MSLAYTLLGFLNYEAMTGYDLKKQIDASTTFFWHAELAQIYPTLKQLEETGLVVADIKPQQGNKPDKRLYTITPAGRAALQDWLNRPLDRLPAKKEPALLQVFFSGSLDKTTLLEQLRRQLALHRAQLEQYQTKTRAHIQAAVESSGLQREGMMWELVRDHGVGYEQHYIEWLEHAIQTVEEKF